LLITQNKYPAKIINEWNGQLEIKEDVNTILSARIVAGSKDSVTNTFSGVMMGDWHG
jgi:hypothetical protein